MISGVPSRVLEGFPPIKGVRWFNVGVLTVTPTLALYGLFTTSFNLKTALATLVYYVFSTLGITAGYHRLWSHRAYNASYSLQVFLMIAGASAVQGSCYWWARRHRSHHRHTDTDADPYNAQRGLLWTHIGWMLFDTDLRPGTADISDLQRDPLVQWQHRWYFYILAIWGYALPTLLPGFWWGDWRGGLFFVGALRMTITHHGVFCVNSLAHYIGSAPFDDRLTPRDHLISAVLTMGEGYHNFHHQFPMDYRNATRWYQYDPTKWFIVLCWHLGLATNLREFPSNEVRKGELAMSLKKLKEQQDTIQWPKGRDHLPVVEWETFRKDSEDRTLVLISGFIHDATDFLDAHPGGRALLAAASGKDMTAAFFGGVYPHSNAAHNLLTMMRVGILHGGVEEVGDADSPAIETTQRNSRSAASMQVPAPSSQKLYIAEGELCQ